MASAFCGLPTHMVRVVISFYPPVESFGEVQGEVVLQGETDSPRASHSYGDGRRGEGRGGGWLEGGGGMVLVMATMRNGFLQATAASPQSVEWSTQRSPIRVEREQGLLRE